MSDDLSSRSVCVIDDGQFFDLAVRLTREFGKVYFHNPTLVEGFPRASKWAIGRGFKDVEWIEKLYTHKDKIDLFVFPDILTSDDQLELESQGRRVIGSRTGDNLEVLRIAFKKVQKRLGLNVPKHVVVDGLTELREHLKKVEDKYIKISRFRGSFETKHHVNYKLSEFWLNALSVELGPLSDEILFLVEDPIRGDVEFGYDGFCFDGQFPDTTLFGPEIKSKCYIGAVTKYSDLDERLRQINKAIALELKLAGYKNFFSTEIRIAKDDENFKDGEPVLIEPTCRIPSPPFEAELESYKNLGKILWHGSVGEIISPEMADNFAVVCRMSHDDEPENPRAIQVPDESRQWVKLYDPFYKDDTYYIMPRKPHAARIGAVVGIGDTIEKALEHCADNLEAIKDQPVSSEFMFFTEALKEIHSAEKQDIEFSDRPVPEQEIVLESS
jgi:sRNA-binding carbon storage regulator CsrA